MQIATQEQALAALLADQVRGVGMTTQPAWPDTIESATGWAFFNVNGYLGTVTRDGEVLVDDDFVDDE